MGQPTVIMDYLVLRAVLNRLNAIYVPWGQGTHAVRQQTLLSFDFILHMIIRHPLRDGKGIQGGRSTLQVLEF